MVRNRYLEAFKENFNVLGLAGVAALSAALLTPIPLLIGIVAEAAYLLFVPDSAWYTSRMARRFDGEVEARREQVKAQVLPTLRAETRERFNRLEELRRGLDAQNPPEAEWFAEVRRKLDFLLEKFLQFAARDAQFRDYLENTLRQAREESGTRLHITPPSIGDSSEKRALRMAGEIEAHYTREIEELAKTRDEQTDDGTKAVLQKRIEVVTRRREFAGKIGRILVNLNHQLGLLEDTFGLIADEIRARPPEQVLADIEDVVTQTQAMTQALEEVAAFDPLLTRTQT